MSKAKRFANGYTMQFAKDWDRACKWAKGYCKRMFHREWHDDKIAHEYMAARNGYKAGHSAGYRAGRRSLTAEAGK